MVARRGDTARVEDDDVVGVAYGVEPVGDDDAGASAAGRGQFTHDAGLAAFVDRAGGLVQDQDRGVGQQRPCEGEPLALSAGERGTAFADEGGVTVRQPGDLLVDPGGAGGGTQLFVGGGRSGDPQVLRDRGVEEVGVLRDDGDAPAQ